MKIQYDIKSIDYLLNGPYKTITLAQHISSFRIKMKKSQLELILAHSLW